MSCSIFSVGMILSLHAMSICICLILIIPFSHTSFDYTPSVARTRILNFKTSVLKQISDSFVCCDLEMNF